MYRVEAAHPSLSNYTKNITIVENYVQFGTISWKFDFVNNCLIKDRI